MVDLKPFCGTEKTRFYLQTPWSRGNYTYATNGHIMVRVPRVEGVDDRKECPDPAKPFAKCAEQPLSSLTLALPAEQFEECDDCCEGKAHGCPCCTCACSECGGSGEISDDYKMTVEIRGVTFSGQSARLLSRLHGLKFSVRPPAIPGGDPSNADPTYFAFDGGDGCLMPYRDKKDRHIEIEETA